MITNNHKLLLVKEKRDFYKHLIGKVHAQSQRYNKKIFQQLLYGNPKMQPIPHRKFNFQSDLFANMFCFFLFVFIVEVKMDGL